MKRLMTGGLAVLASVGLLLWGGSALASGGETHELKDHDWPHASVFGTFDRAQLQRGWQVYSEVCAGCHAMEYLAFRNKLMPASGFQSAQMRQIEVLFGLNDDERVPLGSPGSHIAALKNADGSPSSALKHLRETQADGPSLLDAVRSWLERTPIDGVRHGDAGASKTCEDFLNDFLASQRIEVDKARKRAREVAPESDHKRIDDLYDREIAATEEFLRGTDVKDDPQRARARVAMLFIETYRELPLLAWPREVLASLIEVEQAFLIYRQRHARMVERVIGRRVGTGGSSGVDYLDKTAIEYRIFRDLWTIRTLLLRNEAAPSLKGAAFYSFSAGD